MQVDGGQWNGHWGVDRIGQVAGSPGGRRGDSQQPAADRVQRPHQDQGAGAGPVWQCLALQVDPHYLPLHSLLPSTPAPLARPLQVPSPMMLELQLITACRTSSPLPQYAAQPPFMLYAVQVVSKNPQATNVTAAPFCFHGYIATANCVHVCSLMPDSTVTHVLCRV